MGLLRTLRFITASRRLLALLWCRQILLLLSAPSTRRLLLLLLRPLRTLFLLALRLRPLGLFFLLGLLTALLSGRLGGLLWLRSALLPLGIGMSFRLVPIFASMLILFLLVPLCITGSDGPGKHKQSGCVYHSDSFHGRCLRARDAIT